MRGIEIQNGKLIIDINEHNFEISHHIDDVYGDGLVDILTVSLWHNSEYESESDSDPRNADGILNMIRNASAKETRQAHDPFKSYLDKNFD